MRAVLSFPPVSPEIFSISVLGMDFALRWYALAYIVGILIGWRLAVAAVRRARLWPHDTPPMTPPEIEQLMTSVILGIILGGRLGYVLFYQPGYYLTHPLEILRIWEGGMSFHGGLLGVLAGVTGFCLMHRKSLLSTFDILAIAVPAGLLLGRLANFVNAELWGRPSDLPWAVIFPGEAAQSCGQALGELCARHPSQLYEALLEGVVLGLLILVLAFRSRALKHPGQLAGVFGAGYGMARFAVEFVRQPDAQFVSEGNPLGLAWQVGDYGLTMGQILSLPMILLGLALIVWARRSAGDPPA